MMFCDAAARDVALAASIVEMEKGLWLCCRVQGKQLLL